jgi:hypothetical protein
MDFKRLCETARFYYPERSNEWLFKTAIRIKRWLIDTSKTGIWTNSTQNKIYLDGFEKIKKEIKKSDLENMYKGKIKIKDLDFIV